MKEKNRCVFTRYLNWAVFVLGFFLISAPAVRAQTKSSDNSYATKLYQSLRYRPIGPYKGGRSIAVSGVKSKPYTFYFGAAGGGLWKTTDGGKTWLNVSDSSFTDASVGAVTVAPSDPNVVYAGMGESAIRGDFFTGNGLYKSTDGGKT